jgi:hypothetical protein
MVHTFQGTNLLSNIKTTLQFLHLVGYKIGNQVMLYSRTKKIREFLILKKGDWDS